MLRDRELDYLLVIEWEIKQNPSEEFPVSKWLARWVDWNQASYLHTEN